MTPNDSIASGYRMAKLAFHRMVDDLAPAEFHHQPVPGANSAAWIIGHLASTLRRTAERLGVTGLPELPAEVAGKLATTKQPAGDQSSLGDAARLVAVFDVCVDKIIEAVRLISAETLAGPPTMPPAPLATSYAESLLFGSLHITMHTGQLSTIRRSLGKPPVV